MPKRSNLFSLPAAKDTSGTRPKATNKAGSSVHTHVSVKTAYTLFLFSILTIVLVQILEGLYSDIASGGEGWRQGDWLINNEYQLVRRGIFGSLIFRVSDYLSISPLTLLGIIQGVVLVFTFSVVIVFVARLGANTRILCICSTRCEKGLAA